MHIKNLYQFFIFLGFFYQKIFSILLAHVQQDN